MLRRSVERLSSIVRGYNVTNCTRLPVRWLAASLIALLAGCSTKQPTFDRVPIEGAVTLDGQPLTAGVIRFAPLAGALGPKLSLSIDAGRFQADMNNGPGVGLHRVEIELTESEQYAHDDEQALERLKASRVRRIQEPKLPAIYNNSSTLTASIESEAMKPLEFALQSKPSG